jgi:hypothetical protein
MKSWRWEVLLPHRIVVFTDGSSLSKEIVDEIEAGKCARCELTVYKISDHTTLAEKYGVRVSPTMIIDEEVKIEGRPDIPFVCSNETYAHFKEKYPMLHELGSSPQRR